MTVLHSRFEGKHPSFGVVSHAWYAFLGVGYISLVERNLDHTRGIRNNICVFWYLSS
jgi:hypothetical protein